MGFLPENVVTTGVSGSWLKPSGKSVRILMGICAHCLSWMQSRERLCAKCETMKSLMPKWPWLSGGGRFRRLLVP